MALRGLKINESANMEPNPAETKLLQDQGVRYQEKKLLNMSNEVLAEFDENTQSVKYEQNPKGGVLLTISNKDGSKDRYIIQEGHIETATDIDQAETEKPSDGLSDMGPGTRYAIIPKVE